MPIMGEATANVFDSFVGDGNVDGGKEKIITVGPSAWESSQKYLVDELRRLLRARDIALAEQRARHVKESVVFREQRHALAVNEPDFSEKIAKLFGWTDAGGPSKLSLSVSPLTPSSSLPIGSPATSMRGVWQDDRVVPLAGVMKDIEMVSSTETSPRLEQSGLPVVFRNSDGRSEEPKSGSSTHADPGKSRIADPTGDEEWAIAACPRCTQLRHELEVVLTDRTLAEAELVSLRRAVSLADTRWESESARVGAFRYATNEKHPDQHKDKHEGAGETTLSSPREPEESNFCLQEELGQIERQASLQESAASPSKVQLQELFLQPESELKSKDSTGLSASLSATIGSRARYFEDLARRRILRLGLEADLRAARAKLNDLLASAGAKQNMPEHAEGGDDRSACGKEGQDGTRRNSTWHNCKSGRATRKETQNEVAGRDTRQPPNHDLVGSAGSARVLLETAKDSEAQARPTRARGGSFQQPQHCQGRNQGNIALLAGAHAMPSKSERGSCAQQDKTAKPGSRQVKLEKGSRPTLENSETVTKRDVVDREKMITSANPRTVTAATQGEQPEMRENTTTKRAECVNADDTRIIDQANLVSSAKGASLMSEGIEEAGEAPGSGVVECARDEEPPTRNEESSWASTAVISSTARSKEVPSTQGHGNARGYASAKPGKGTTTNAPQKGLGRARSPRNSPGRPHSLSLPAAQLRKNPSSPRGGLRSGRSATSHSEKPNEAVKERNGSSAAADDESQLTRKTISNVGLDDIVNCRQQSLEPSAPAAVDELVTEKTKSSLQAAGAEAAGTKKRVVGSASKDDARREKMRAKGGQVAPDPNATISSSRPHGKPAKAKPVLRERKPMPMRLGGRARAKQASAENSIEDAGDTVHESVRIGPCVAVGEVEELFVDTSLTWSGVGKAAEEGGDEEGETERTKWFDRGVETAAAWEGSNPQENIAFDVHDEAAVKFVHDSEAVRSDGRRKDGGEDADVMQGKRGRGGADAASGPVAIRHHVDNDCLIPPGIMDLTEALGIEVDKLRLEKAELEDTVAQLNVAAAQLYFAEYEEMKAKCRQLKRVVSGPSSTPTCKESAFGQSCQEILHQVKKIGVNFFRRRVGGAMGANFFPDGLARTLSLIGRERVSQACQTAPIERLKPLLFAGASPPLPGTKDVHVQVAGGIDAEDEPLMEQQVYSLLGKLDLLLKQREDVLRHYHQEAEEGAREARALLALAAAQHRPGQAWGVSHPPNIRRLIAGREGPAGAPRPAINPTNILFTAAVVLDSAAAAAAGDTPQPFHVTTSEAAAKGGCGDGNRRQRFSLAERALMELANEIVAALEVEQRRSDAAAERRRFCVERHSSVSDGADKHGEGGGTQMLGRPAVGVPPLIWAMDIHLVGKLARAFQTAVEARGFEREVEDANLVAAVSLGRSPTSVAEGGKCEGGPPWHLAHRALSVVREEGDEEEKKRRERARVDFEREKGRVAQKQEQQRSFDWGIDPYSPRGMPHRSKGGPDGTVAFRAHSSGTSSPTRTDGLARAEQPRRQPTKGRGYAGGSHEGSTLEPRSAQQRNDRGTGVAGARRNPQVQQQHQQQQQHHGKDTGAAARVEAAVFNTVRPSRLHVRPGSASVESRSGRVASERYYSAPAASPDRVRPRPHSARLAEPGDNFTTDDRRWIAREHTAATCDGTPPESRERRVDGRGGKQPVRPIVNSFAGPDNAGGRVIDTRIWSSTKNATARGAGVFRCRPNNIVRATSVRFDSDGVPDGTSSPPLIPTHSGEVPEFLRRKERELVKFNREKWEAVNGRFTVGSHGADETHRIRFVSESNSSQERIEYRSSGRSTNESYGEKREAATTNYGCGAGRGDRVLSSVRLEDSMDGEGLLPDAGEQAFFDAWKPTGYEIDLSRYD